MRSVIGAAAAALAVGILAVPASAHPAGNAGSCGGESDAVLGAAADRAAVELVAWVLKTDCILDSGDRKTSGLPAATSSAYDGQTTVVVGGVGAVPKNKLKGIKVSTRLWGADRLETMRAVVKWADGHLADDSTTSMANVNRVIGLLSELTVAPEQTGNYRRVVFRHWVDADGDGCDARKEVLIAEAIRAPQVGERCSLSGGEWLSRYDGRRAVGDGGSFDVDHMVPLSEAWESGARIWDAKRREAFANDLGYADSLVAVSASSNRSKGGRDPAEWMPPAREAHCWYAAAWVSVKSRWGLAADRAEADKLRSVLSGCTDEDLGDVPEAVSAGTVSGPAAGTGSDSNVPCHPAYEPCLPYLAGDALNCNDLNRSQKPVKVKVPGNDPYNLDRDGNGVGCTG